VIHNQDKKFIKTEAPYIGYTKGFYGDTELLYKFLKCDGKLVRQICENSGFQHTDRHDWNILWTNTGGKPYLYEGLNEF
jgi:hypothetical protein